MRTPTADDVARAIVAACKETGDDPIRTAEGGLGTSRATNRARHYAMHALLHVFQGLGREMAARLVGCPGSPRQFWSASWHQIVKPRVGGLGHAANWFDDDAYARVIAAIEGVMRDDVEEELEPEPEPYRPPAGTVEKVLKDDAVDKPKPAPRLGTLEGARGYRPPPGTIEDVLKDDRPVIERGGKFARKIDEGSSLMPGPKRSLYDDLAQAVRNTAKMTRSE